MGKLSVEDVARIRAAVDTTPQPEVVFRLHEVDASAWAMVEETTLAELDDRLERGDAVGVEMFRTAYARERKALGAPTDDVAAPLDQGPPDGAGARSNAQPSLLEPENPDETGMTDARQILAGLRGVPFVKGAPSKLSKPEAAPVDPDAHGETVELDARKVFGPTTPFAKKN